jgi:alkylation response protein AidB-like acyl-CoA dehydrogenase
MPQFIADLKDVEFNLYEIFDLVSLCCHERFKNLDRTAFKLILTEARDFALKEMLAAYPDGDREGVSYRDGQVRVPESFHRVHRYYCDNQWNAPASAPDYGGQGLPKLLAAAIQEYMMGANWPVYAYGSMGVDTGGMIQRFGSEEQKETYVRNLYTGRWGGTMLHTEPEAGSDLGALATRAVQNRDGTYSLTGLKMFITNGDHDLCENIIHLVLARIQGDPKGIKGLSMFIVPKFMVSPGAQAGKANGIYCSGIEKKHGLHGSAACCMTLGCRGTCTGYLLGEPGQGMKILDTLMNQDRLNVGLQALAYGSSAYLYALNHARNRIQGRSPQSQARPEVIPVPIIRHPDVKRTLMEMKAVIEGLRSLIYFAMACLDRAGIETDKKTKKELLSLVELLIPVIKGYGCEQGYQVCVQAIQVFGGAGYCRDYPVEAITRDCKITTLYKGCTGIQAIDLLNRKLFRDQGKTIRTLIRDMNHLIENTLDQKTVAPLGRQFKTFVDRFSRTLFRLEKQFAAKDRNTLFAQATPFMGVMGDFCLAWMHLLRASTAENALAGKDLAKSERDFYKNQIRTACFFYQTVLPPTMGKMESLKDYPAVISDLDDADFGGI